MTGRPAASPPLASAPASARVASPLRHWPIVAVLAVASGVRLAAWLAIHPAWWFLGDSISYVLEAINEKPDPWRPNGYSILLLGPLFQTHRLAYVTAVQHLMGLAVGVIVYVVVLRLGVRPWLAALAAIPALLDGNVIASEQMLLSEPLFTLLLVAACAVLLIWSAARYGVVACAVAGLLLGLATITRTIALPLIVIAVVAVFVRRPGWLRPAAMFVAFAIPVVWYAVWFSQAYGQPNLTVSTGTFLYGRASQFVECDTLTVPDPKLMTLCPTEPVGQRDELFYVFSESSPLGPLTGSKTLSDAYAGRFAVAAIREQPLGYAAVVWRDIVRAFDVETSWQSSQYQFRMNEPMPKDASAAALAYQGRDPALLYRPSLVAAMAAYQGVLWVPGPLTLLALVVAALGFLLGRDSERRGLRSAVLLTAGAATVMLIAPAFITGFELRYRLPAIPLLTIATAASVVLIANRVRATRTTPLLGEYAPLG